MDNRVKINNLEDLKRERLRLRLLAKEQEDFLGNQYDLLRKKVAAPVRIFNTVVSYIPGVSTIQALFSAKPGKSDNLFSKIANLAIPLVANRFLPRKTGLMTRGIFSFLAKQITALLTSGKLSEIISQITSALQRPASKKTTHPLAKDKKGATKEEDFGIPPDSETY